MTTPTSRGQITLGNDWATNRNLEMAFESPMADQGAPLIDAPDKPFDPGPDQFSMMGAIESVTDAPSAIASGIAPESDTKTAKKSPKKPRRPRESKAKAKGSQKTESVEPTGIPGVLSIPIDQITTRPDLFQARDVDSGKSFDPKRVQQIVDNWNPDRFDPIVVVSDGQGGYIVLAGHHRLEAMRVKGESTIPGRLVDGDINSPDDRKRMMQEAVVSNFNIAESNFRERATAAQRLSDSGWNTTEIAANMRLKGRPEAERLLWLHAAGPVIMNRVTIQPELAPMGMELGRAIVERGFDPETAQGLFQRWVADYDETDRVPGVRSLRRQIDLLGEIDRKQGSQGGMLTGFEGDVVITEFDQNRRELTDVSETIIRNRARMTSCEALAVELGVDIKELQKAANTQNKYLTQQQESKARQVMGLKPLARRNPAKPYDSKVRVGLVETPQVATKGKASSKAAIAKTVKAKPGAIKAPKEPKAGTAGRSKSGPGRSRVGQAKGGATKAVNVKMG